MPGAVLQFLLPAEQTYDLFRCPGGSDTLFMTSGFFFFFLCGFRVQFTRTERISFAKLACSFHASARSSSFDPVVRLPCCNLQPTPTFDNPPPGSTKLKGGSVGPGVGTPVLSVPATSLVHFQSMTVRSPPPTSLVRQINLLVLSAFIFTTPLLFF